LVFFMKHDINNGRISMCYKWWNPNILIRLCGLLRY